MFSWDPVFVKLLRFVYSGIQHQKISQGWVRWAATIWSTYCLAAQAIEERSCLVRYLDDFQAEFAPENKKTFGKSGMRTYPWGVSRCQWRNVGAVDMPKAGAETNATADWKERRGGRRPDGYYYYPPTKTRFHCFRVATNMLAPVFDLNWSSWLGSAQYVDKEILAREVKGSNRHRCCCCRQLGNSASSRGGGDASDENQISVVSHCTAAAPIIRGP